MRKLFLGALAALALACGDGGGDGDGGDEVFLPAPPGSVPPVGHPQLARVDDFCYVLDSPDLAAIGASQYDLAVIDYSADGSDARAFTRDQITALKASTAGKVVLAYLSIGEAEDYRFYWELEGGRAGGDWRARPPAWLGPENPDFPGNYKVRYWDPEWQAIIIANPGGHPVLGGEASYLDRVIAAGFDGVFLDIIDAFEFFGPPGDGGTGERPTAAADMAAFIGAIAEHARAAVPGFIICQQNGENLMSPDLDIPLTAAEIAALLAAVDHLSLEDVFFQGEADENNGFAPLGQRILDADRYRQEGKLVTIIDYFDALRPGYSAADVDRFFALAGDRGWVAYTGPRDLDRLVITPGHAPD